MISYAPLWRTMEQKGYTTYTIRKNDAISSSTVRRLKENQSVSTNTLDTLCRILGCTLQDVAEYVPDEIIAGL